eukprot:5500224-Prymnesium_polylepis.1
MTRVSCTARLPSARRRSTAANTMVEDEYDAEYAEGAAVEAGGEADAGDGDDDDEYDEYLQDDIAVVIHQPEEMEDEQLLAADDVAGGADAG